MNDLHEMAANSREAAWTLAASSLETRNAALLRMAETLENHQADIFAANAADIHQAEADGLAAPLLGRLKFREEKLRAVTDGLRALAALPDPIPHGHGLAARTSWNSQGKRTLPMALATTT